MLDITRIGVAMAGLLELIALVSKCPERKLGEFLHELADSVEYDDIETLLTFMRRFSKLLADRKYAQ